MVHELQVQQIELEMQNEELRRAQSELEEARNRYSNLYDFAPIGYFTFDKNGLIIEVNLTGANKLGIERSFLIKKLFSLYIAFSSRDVFYLHLRKVFNTNTRQTCEIKIVDKNKNQFDARLESLLVHENEGNFSLCRTAISDITERKKIEEENSLLASIVESSDDAIIGKTVDGTILSWNSGAQKIYGYTANEVKGRSISILVPPGKTGEIPQLLQKIRQGQPIEHYETVRMRKDGKQIDVYLTISPIKDSTGKIIGASTIARDITERKRTEEKLRRAHDELEIRVQERTAELEDANKELEAEIIERKRAEEGMRLSEENYRELANSISDPFFALNKDLCFTYWNRASEMNTGIPTDSIIGEYLFDVFPELKGTQLERAYNEAIATGKAQFLENRWDQQGGAVTYHDVSIYPTADGIAVFSKDVTERKHMEEALHKVHDELEIRVQTRTAELQEANKALMESEASYRELTESIEDLFYAIDGDLKYAYWNKASEVLTGISAKDAIGKSLYELFHDIKGTKAEQFYIKALKMRQPQRFESQFQIGGKKFIFEINAYPTKTGLSVIAKDITERKMFEAHLLRAQRMESIGTLAGGIAHDLNNMLTPMMLSLQMLKEKFKDEQSQKLLTILENNSRRSADLVKQVLSFARGIEGERKPLQISHIISEIDKITKETFSRNIESRTDVPNDLWTISGDVTQLHQVIMNLCVNARDAMPYGGVLCVSAENFFVDKSYAKMNTETRIGPYVVITVSDTGTGIPPEVMDRIFEPFFTTKEHGKGTGLGLSTAHAIVKSHGGFIDLNSEVGKGTAVRIYLPAIKTEIHEEGEQQPELLTGDGEWILVAEDEKSIRDVTLSTLETYGYKVLTANDGAEAVALYAENMDKIKVILMDLMMPVMDGQASIRAIRRICTGVKIIAVSGLAEKDRLTKVADYTNAFLPKPYTAEKLLKTIHEVLGGK